MKKIILCLSLFLLSGLASAGTEGMGELGKYNCSVESVSGQIEKDHPKSIFTVVMAQSSASAKAMYLMRLSADMAKPTITIPYSSSIKENQVVDAIIKKVSCD